jgi:Secretion system C-terminal sorting domain
MFRHILFLSLLGSFQVVVAQNLSPTVVNNSGGVISILTHSLEWSLGEIAVTTISGGGNLLSQGFLQPNLLGTVPARDLFDESKFKAYPNPVSTELILETDLKEIASVAVFDLSGKLLMKTAFKTRLDLQHLNKGLYVIALFNKQAQFLHALKITKI